MVRVQRLVGHFKVPSAPLSASAAAAEDARKPVCLVIGAGAGIGQGVARKFAKEGVCDIWNVACAGDFSTSFSFFHISH
jgi:hypothetical protein